MKARAQWASFLVAGGAVLASIGGCGSGGGSGGGGDTSNLTLHSIAFARLIEGPEGPSLLPPDSVVRFDPETGEVLQVVEPGTTWGTISSSEGTISAVPRNAALILQFTAAVDPATVDAQSVRLRERTSGATVATRMRVEGRLVILDSVIDAGEAKEHGLPVRVSGLPEGGVTGFANLELEIPTDSQARLKDLRGRPIQPRPEDRGVGRASIAVQFRSGGREDEHRGFLPDVTPPILLSDAGREYRANRDEGAIDVAEILRTDIPPDDDLTRVLDEELPRSSDGTGLVDFEVGPPVALAAGPLAPGRVRIGALGEPSSFVEDLPVDLDEDGAFDVGVFNDGIDVQDEDTGKPAEEGQSQSFDDGSYALRHPPLEPGSVRLFESGNPANFVVDDGAGGLVGSGSIDYSTGALTGIVQFPLPLTAGGSIVADYESTRRGWIDYGTRRVHGVVQLEPVSSPGSPIVASYAYRERTKDRVEEVPGSSRVGLRFSEPLDPTSLGGYSTLFVTSTDRGSTRFPGAAAFGRLELSDDGRTAHFAPSTFDGWGPDPGAYALVLVTDDPFTSRVEGVRDLAGNGIDGGVPSPELFDDGRPRHVMRFDFTVAELPGSRTTGLVAETFVPRDAWDDEILNEHDRDGPEGFLVGGAITRWTWSLKHPNQGGLTPNFPPGVSTPYNPNGARSQHLVPASMLGGPSQGQSWLIEGIEWSPINGQLFTTRFASFEMRLAHSDRIPVPSVPASGLFTTFQQNIETGDPAGVVTVFGPRPYELRQPGGSSSPFFYAYPQFERLFAYNAQDSLLIDMGIAADQSAGLFNGYEIFFFPTVQPFYRVFSVGSMTSPITAPFQVPVATGVPGQNPPAPGDSSVYIHRFHFTAVRSQATSPYYLATPDDEEAFVDWHETVIEPASALQPPGTSIVIEYYGDDDGQGSNATGWVTHLDALDGRRWVRVRLSLDANPLLDLVPVIDSVALSYHPR